MKTQYDNRIKHTFTTATIALAAVPAIASAQTGVLPQWRSWDTVYQDTRVVTNVEAYDPDGAGPSPAHLFVARGACCGRGHG